MTKPDKAIAPQRDPAAQPADRIAVTAHASGPLVINLCSSNTPMTLVRPDAPELARFTFFVSRRREEGRERFRLHMGYFETRAEAEQLLLVVREVYPAAWVGDAPGQNLRPESRAASANATAAAAPAAATATANAPRPPSQQQARPAAPAAAAPQPARAAAPASAATPASTVRAPAASAAPASARPATAAPVAAQPAARPAAATPSLAPAPSLVTMRTSAPAGKPPTAAAPPQSNVREVLAQLDGAAPPPRATPRPAAPPAHAAPAHATPSAPAAPAAPASRSTVVLPTREELEFELLHGGADATDSQVLRVLEQRVAPESNAPAARRADTLPREARDIPVQRPQDTMTWKEIRQEIAREANVSFALQLVWSPNPIDPATVPALAIFDAYTLYNVEVTRPHAKQYGLRLGFFSDAMSAKQVAAYVRSEFLSVAVVPVTLGERDQAQKSGGIQLARPVAPAGNSMQAEEITLIDELTPPRTRPAAAAAPVVAKPQAELPAGKPAPSKAAAAKPARASRPRGGGPRTLEETLEILGASQLSIDNGKGERLNIGSRTRPANDKRSSTFSKLLDRLSTRLKP